ARRRTRAPDSDGRTRPRRGPRPRPDAATVPATSSVKKFGRRCAAPVRQRSFVLPKSLKRGTGCRPHVRCHERRDGSVQRLIRVLCPGAEPHGLRVRIEGCAACRGSRTCNPGGYMNMNAWTGNRYRAVGGGGLAVAGFVLLAACGGTSGDATT